MSRTSSLILGTITYPDKRVFAFSPYVATIVGSTAIGEVAVTFGTYQFKRYCDASGGMRIPISSFLQSVFKDYEFGTKTPMSKNFTITVTANIGTANESSVDMVFDVIWGAIQAGEVECTDCMLYYFSGFPLTISQTIEGDIRDEDGVGIISSISYGNDFDIGAHLLANPTRNEFTIYDTGIVRTYSVERSACQEGVYLRWIDIHGEHYYYLFQYGQSDIRSKSGSTFNNQIYTLDPVTSTQFGDIYKGSVQLKNKTVGKSITCGIGSADDNLTKHAESLASSLQQWMYFDGNWIEVQIPSLSISRKNRENRREINIKIVLPDYYTQSR